MNTAPAYHTSEFFHDYASPSVFKISFIVPIYNVEKYLCECLDSILSQSVSKEIILIDDGSADDSLKLALDYGRRYDFITVVHSQNQGLSAARNKGIRLARGEFIYCVDSDDYLLDVNLGNVVDVALQHDVDVVKLQARQQVDLPSGDGKMYYFRSAYPNLEQNKGRLMTGYECLTMMTEGRHWIPGVCWTLIRRRFLVTQGLAFKDGIKAEDQLFYVQLLTCLPNVKVLEVGNVLYHYRLRANSIVTSPNKQYFLDHFGIVALLERWMQQNALPAEIERGINVIIAILYRTAVSMFNRFSDADKMACQEHLTQKVYDYMNQY